MRKLALLTFAVAFALAFATPASAHNAAHFYLPNGECHEVGSNKSAPFVGAGNPNQNSGQLDLIPGSGDQYGARYAADQSPQLLPGNCP
jgi:hypothetical protein